MVFLGTGRPVPPLLAAVPRVVVMSTADWPERMEERVLFNEESAALTEEAEEDAGEREVVADDGEMEEVVVAPPVRGNWPE